MNRETIITMKYLPVTYFLILSITYPIPGYSSYHDEFNEKYNSHLSDNIFGNLNNKTGAKCLMLVDLIKYEQNEDKRKHLKRNLEVEILYLMDEINTQIECLESLINMVEESLAESIDANRRKSLENELQTYKDSLSMFENHKLRVQELLRFTEE